MDFKLNEKGGWIIPKGANIPSWTVIPDYSELGNFCNFGSCCKFGENISMEGKAVKYFMQSDNIDGSGRRIQFIYDGEDVFIRAACFFGASEEFCDKAAKEGKTVYPRIVRSIANEIRDIFK